MRAQSAVSPGGKSSLTSDLPLQTVVNQMTQHENEHGIKVWKMRWKLTSSTIAGRCVALALAGVSLAWSTWRITKHQDPGLREDSNAVSITCPQLFQVLDMDEGIGSMPRSATICVTLAALWNLACRGAPLYYSRPSQLIHVKPSRWSVVWW